MITWPKTLMSITVARENQRDKPNSRTRIAYSRRKARTEFLESDRLNQSASVCFEVSYEIPEWGFIAN